MLINGHITTKFKATELHYFSWLFGIAPCFPVKAANVNIITDPRKFYDTLCERFKKANTRIAVASLYVGTGDLEKRLLQLTRNNLINNKALNFNVVLDFQRGTRGDINSQTILKEFVGDIPGRCHVSFYQTPRLQGSWSKTLPSRYNELVGLQHMKLYITDNSVLLSGANYSNDYFKQRQDRYIEIEDENLANFYCELIEELSYYSKKWTKDGSIDKSYINKDIMINEMSKRVVQLINKWKDVQLSKLESTNDFIDTWVFPLLQMGEFKITQDEQVTKGILSSAPKSSYIRLATGYFNLTDEYAKTLLSDCKANISLLMAHPNANGFLGAAGPAGGIPHAYSLIAKKFWQRVEDSNQASRVQMLEYERPGWTFHAKGLWYYPPGSDVPIATLVGSANLGARSVRRDLEAQALIFTLSPDLRARLHEECSKLHEYSSECSVELQKRKTPLWVQATVFRKKDQIL